MNPPKMPIHIGDLLRDTGHLRAQLFGAYILLLFHHWSTGSLPEDDEQLSAIARLTPAEWKKARPILIKFFDERWIHGRVTEDLESAKQSYEKRAKAGSEGGKAKASGKQSSSNATPDATAGLKQPLTYNQSKKEDTPADAGSTPARYVFESGIVRLNERDFEQWRSAFSNLDLAAELLSLSEWASSQPNWFHAVKGALAKRNRDVKANKQKAEQQPFKWNGIEGVL